MEEIVLSTRPGVTSRIFEQDGKIVVVNQQDCDAVIAETKAKYASAESGWAGDWHLIAQLPLMVFMDLHAKGILADPKAMRRWLNDPDNRAFRVKAGRI